MGNHLHAGSHKLWFGIISSLFSCNLSAAGYFLPGIRCLIVFWKRRRKGLDDKIQLSEPDRKYAGNKALD